MDPLIKEWDVVLAAINYYDCYEIARDDIVLYQYVGNKNPLIKQIKGAAGDSFVLKLKNGGDGLVENWQILINDEVLTTASNEPYNLIGKKYEMLALYEKSYNNIIPKDSYLLLAEMPRGGTDSTSFGFVHKNNIIAKVLIKEK